MDRRRTRRRKTRTDLFIDIINDSFQEILRGRSDPTKHLFFESIQWWKKNHKEMAEDRFKTSKQYNYNPACADIEPLGDCRFSPKKTLTESYLKDFYAKLYESTNYKEIRATCHEMTEYALPSTIPSLETWKHYDSPDAINVVILGAGPVGLFTALYLNQYYNKFENRQEFKKEFILRNINILVVDNRIKEEGDKLPYSRSTQFGFNIAEIQPFLQNIFCWKMERNATRAFDYIHVLENLLYTVAVHDKIPMRFTRKFDDYKQLKSFIRDQSVHLLFDCTGGRSTIPNPNPNPSESVSWNKFSFRATARLKKGNQAVILNKTTGYYEFCEDGHVYTEPTYRIQIFDKNNKEILIGNVLAFPTEKADTDLALKYNNLCFRPEDYLRLSACFKSEQIRTLFPHIVETQKLKLKDIKAVKISVFYSIARHSPFAAARLSRQCTLLRVGDSLGSTEYGILFGMKHSIEFSRHICNLVSSFIP